MLVRMIFCRAVWSVHRFDVKWPVYRLSWSVYWLDGQNCKQIHSIDGMGEVESGNFCFSLSTISRSWQIDTANGICGVFPCLLSSTAGSILLRKIWSSCQNMSNRVVFSLPLHLRRSSSISGSSRSKRVHATCSWTFAWEKYSALLLSFVSTR